MKTLRLNARPTFWLAAFLAALGLTSLAAKPVGAAAPDSMPGASASAVGTPLRWNFQVGNTFRIREVAVTLSIDSFNHSYRNEVELVYVWCVTEVSPDGTATLVVTPESVEIHSQFPLDEYDTARDDFAIAPTEELTWRAHFVEGRPWAEAGMTCRVTNTGHVVDIWSNLPVAETSRLMGFTPEVFARLPGGAIQLGDRWNVALSRAAEIKESPTETAYYRLADCWCKEDRDVLHIEGAMTSTARSERRTEFGPMISVSHFDPINQYFLDQVSVTSGQVSMGPNEIVTIRYSTKRSVTRMTERPVVPTAGLPNTLH